MVTAIRLADLIMNEMIKEVHPRLDLCAVGLWGDWYASPSVLATTTV